MERKKHINSKICLEQLEKIETSKEFSSAFLDKRLLRYLVESSLEGKALKEITIAIDVFDKKVDFNPGEDSSVRSHIYSVRKKLESYYAKEGAKDCVKFIIPKGQYHVTFRFTLKLFTFLKMKSLVFVFWGIITLLLSITTLYLLFENSTQRRTELHIKNPIFTDFIESDLPTLIVVGDYYFYHISQFEYSDISRLTSINSDADFDAFLTEKPNASRYMVKADNSYIGQDVIYGLRYILFELEKIHSDLKIRLASKITYNDLRENNIIYLGSLKALGIVNNLMGNMNIRYSLNPYRIFVTTQNGDTTNVYNIPISFPDNFEWTDYAIATKMAGSNNNTILIISTFNSWDSGTTAKSLTDTQILQNMLDQFISAEAKFPQYFEMLFEINGYRRTSLNAEVLHLFSKE